MTRTPRAVRRIHPAGQPGQGAYDVLVIGAGVVGAAIARELSHHALRVALVEAEADVGEGTSKANTAILHTGFDATPGTMEARLVRRGYQLLKDYATAARIPVEPVGALLVAWDREQVAMLPKLAGKATANGYWDCALISASELYLREPHLGPGALGALEIPGESIICPWTTTLAFATEAVTAGADLILRTRVQGIRAPARIDDVHKIDTSRGELRSRYLVNAAGLSSDQVNRWLGHDGFTITPRRGELIVFDKLARPLVAHILLPVPTARGKGVLVAPTVFGNVLLGPTAEDIDDKTAAGSSSHGLDSLKAAGARILPELLDEEVTAVYAGIRAAAGQGDYQISGHPGERYVCVGGIRSTGLTAAMGIAEYVCGLLADAGLPLATRYDFPPPSMPNIGEAFPRPYARADLIAADLQYGTIVCHCERVTRGEIRDAMNSPIPPRTLGGLRRRTRALTGRCQGFYCGADVRAIFEDGYGGPGEAGLTRHAAGKPTAAQA